MHVIKFVKLANYFNFLKIDVSPCNPSLNLENSTCASND